MRNTYGMMLELALQCFLPLSVETFCWKHSKYHLQAQGFQKLCQDCWCPEAPRTDAKSLVFAMWKLPLTFVCAETFLGCGRGLKSKSYRDTASLHCRTGPVIASVLWGARDGVPKIGVLGQPPACSNKPTASYATKGIADNAAFKEDPSGSFTQGTRAAATPTPRASRQILDLDLNRRVPSCQLPVASRLTIILHLHFDFGFWFCLLPFYYHIHTRIHSHIHTRCSISARTWPSPPIVHCFP